MTKLLTPVAIIVAAFVCQSSFGQETLEKFDAKGDFSQISPKELFVIHFDATQKSKLQSDKKFVVQFTVTATVQNGTEKRIKEIILGESSESAGEVLVTGEKLRQIMTTSKEGDIYLGSPTYIPGPSKLPLFSMRLIEVLPDGTRQLVDRSDVLASAFLEVGRSPLSPQADQMDMGFEPLARIFSFAREPIHGPSVDKPDWSPYQAIVVTVHGAGTSLTTKNAEEPHAVILDSTLASLHRDLERSLAHLSELDALLKRFSKGSGTPEARAVAEAVEKKVQEISSDVQQAKLRLGKRAPQSPQDFHVSPGR